MSDRSLRILWLREARTDGGPPLVRADTELPPGATITWAASVEKAVDVLRREKLDAVVIDADEPATEALAEIERAADIPVLLVASGARGSSGAPPSSKEAQVVLSRENLTGPLLLWSVRHVIERHRLQKRLDEARSGLRRSKENLRNFLSGNPAGVVVTDRKGVVRYVNAAAEDVLGRPSDELVGRRLELRRETGALTEVDLKVPREGGQARGVELQAVECEWEGEPAEVLFLRPANAETTAVTGDRLQHAALEAAPSALLITDANGRILWTNPAFTELTGYTAEEVIGKTPSLLKSGRQDREYYEELWRTILSGRVWHGELVNRRKDGRVYTQEMTIAPVRDPSGGITNFVAIQQSIDDRKELEEQVRLAQRLEAVGRLAGGVAHDFNNILTAITGYSQLVLSEIDPESPLRQDLNEIVKAVDRAAKVTRQLLAFSRKQVLQPEVVDLNEVVANVEELLGRFIGEDIELVTHFHASLWPVVVDPGQMEQVIMNLAVNARDAMPQGGKLVVETANLTLEHRVDRGKFAVPPGRYVMLAVSDNGCGMDEVTLSRIFEPFFTTKKDGKGTGLGLSTVYGIVKQSGGYIWVYSEQGIGTTFKIYLPRVEVTHAAGEHEHEKAGVAPTTSGGKETILVVEDEEAVRELARRMLEKEGYRVLASGGAAEALEVCREHKGPIHLMLTDVVMPVAGGPELAKRIRAIHPETKVLYMSGYPDEAIVEHGVLQPQCELLQKPFDAAGLSRKVREILDAERYGRIRKDAERAARAAQQTHRHGRM